MWLFKKKKNKRKLSCECYCPKCKEGLIESGSFISDTESGVRYTCTECGVKSLWNFDIAPFPVFLREEK